MSSVLAWVLEDDAVASTDDVFLPDIPGVWRAGEPRTAEEIGMTASEVRELVKLGGLPLKETKAPPVADDFLDRTGGMVSGATNDSAPELGLKRDASDVPGLTPAESAERDEWDAAQRPQAIADELPAGAPVTSESSGSGTASAGGSASGSGAGSAGGGTSGGGA